MVALAYGENGKVVTKGDTSSVDSSVDSSMDGLTFQEWCDATDAIEQQAYIRGWQAARDEEKLFGSAWFCLVCFVFGAIVGLLYPR